MLLMAIAGKGEGKSKGTAKETKRTAHQRKAGSSARPLSEKRVSYSTR
jgi:hypothetical protein